MTFGIDTEESGFNPSTARWDEGGFLSRRTVFDPLATVNAAGGVEPYLAESITSNDDYTALHHHAAPRHRLPRRHAAGRRPRSPLKTSRPTAREAS